MSALIGEFPHVCPAKGPMKVPQSLQIKPLLERVAFACHLATAASAHRTDLCPASFCRKPTAAQSGRAATVGTAMPNRPT